MGSKGKQQAHLLALTKQGASWFLIWAEGRGGLVGLPTPLAMLSAGGMRSTLLLLPALQKWQLGFFGLFVSCCP